MQTTEAQIEPDTIEELEYKTLELTLLESDRGRKFLAEFLKRNKTPETQEILAAVQRLEKTVTRQREVPDLGRIRLDIADMHEAIERTKNEIANIKHEGEHTNRFIDASNELDAIVSQTEGATQTILEAAEQIQEQAWTLRENGADESICDEIDAKATEVFMACSFQDLTGQRTTKVVQVLSYLESRINLMINIWGIEEQKADEFAGPVDTRPDAHLLNGPAMEGEGVSQDNVDELMANTGDFLDVALVEPQQSAPVAEDSSIASEADIEALMAGDSDSDVMDAAAIDKMFSSDATDDFESISVTDARANNTSAAEVDFDINNAEVLDEAAIDRLFDNAAEETQADAAWEETEADDAKDPLKELSEAERQALFN